MTPQEEEEFRRLAALPNVYEVISKSIAPSIFGGTDMKKAIACLLFGGSRKRWGAGLPGPGEGTVTRLTGEQLPGGQDMNALFVFPDSALPAPQAPCQLAGDGSIISPGRRHAQPG